jgi:hypothetical protein
VGGVVVSVFRSDTTEKRYCATHDDEMVDAMHCPTWFRTPSWAVVQECVPAVLVPVEQREAEKRVFDLVRARFRHRDLELHEAFLAVEGEEGDQFVPLADVIAGFPVDVNVPEPNGVNLAESVFGDREEGDPAVTDTEEASR